MSRAVRGTNSGYEYPMDLTDGPEREPVGMAPFLFDVYDGAQSSGRGCCAPCTSG